MKEEALYRELLATENRVRRPDAGTPRPVTDYASLVRKETWSQTWDPVTRTLGQVHEVTGSIWSDAIDRCLAENGSAFIPKSATPIYIDRPIVLHSGNRLIVHPETEIRLKIGVTGTCLVRNAGIMHEQTRPVRLGAGADTGILLEGGIWSDQRSDGKSQSGAYDQHNSMPGSHGIFLLHNVAGIVVRNARFRDCSSFAIQLGNATDFLVENITFDETADGIHIEGPSTRGIIRHIAGKTNDDAVALNAWDWDGSSLTFGPITDILVEDIEVRPGYTWSELRLLPGTKVFPSGETVACDIRRCVYRNIRGVHTFKMYDQPNLGKPELDFADPIGAMSDLFFTDIVVDGIRQADYYDPSSDGVFDICADIDGMTIRNVRFNYAPGADDMAPYLVSVGPKALTWLRGKTPADGWKEVFNPNANPEVKGLTVADVYLPVPDQPGTHRLCADVTPLIHERRLTLNPDFPRTMPRGGTGCGRIVEVVKDYHMFTSHHDTGYTKPLPGIAQKTLVYGDKTLMVEFILAKGANLPLHAHPYEQTGYLVKGHIRLTIGDKTYDTQAGDSWTIPVNVQHGATIAEDAVTIEVFAPVRTDYLPT